MTDDRFEKCDTLAAKEVPILPNKERVFFVHFKKKKDIYPVKEDLSSESCINPLPHNPSF